MEIKEFNIFKFWSKYGHKMGAKFDALSPNDKNLRDGTDVVGLGAI